MLQSIPGAQRMIADRSQNHAAPLCALLNGARIEARPIAMAQARALILEPAAFVATVDGAGIEAIVCRKDLDALLGALAPHARWSDISPAAQGEAASALLEALAGAQESDLRPRWSVERIDVAPAGRGETDVAETDVADPTMAVMVSIGGRACPALLRPKDEALAARLAFAFANWPAQRAQSSEAVLLRMCAGVTQLSVRDLKTLEPGDVLRILDPQPDACVAVLGETRACLLREGERAPTFEEMNVIRDSRLKRFLMRADMTDDLHAPADVKRFDDLQVNLVFELGRVSVPLSDLRDGAPDDVFELSGVSGRVDILHQGARIGVGEIVRTGDIYGVRVIRMFSA